MANPVQPNELDYESPYNEMKIARSEHINLNGSGYKATMSYGWDGANPQPLKTDSTGQLLSVDGTTASPVNVGQTTSNTTAAQLNSGSIASINGILVQALSTNSASVFIGGSSVTTSTGFELQAGQAVPFTCSNITSLYVVGANTSDKVCWNVL